MITPFITRSRFRGVYIGLALLWLAGSMALGSFVNTVVRSEVLHGRAKSLSSLLRSHAKNLEVFRDRLVRDELVAEGFIASDKDFEQIIPSRQKLASELALKNCEFLTPTVCLAADRAVVLVGGTENLPMDAASLVLLQTKSLLSVRGLWLWWLGGSLFLAVFTLLIGYGVRSQEKFFSAKVSLLASSIGTWSAALSIPNPSTTSERDEFNAVSLTLEQLGLTLQEREEQILRYKSWLTLQTRKEQLRDTLAHSAHDLRAPLEEGASFLGKYDQLKRTMTDDQLSESMASLAARFSAGIETLKIALRSTSRSADPEASVTIAEIVAQFQKNFSELREARSYTLFVELDPTLHSAMLPIRPDDLSRVLWNLATNAIQARHDGTATLLIEKTVPGLRIRFFDNGPGISAALGEDVFSEFVSTKSSGTGLGLASARRIIESHAGTLRLLPTDSSQGACFEIALPTADLAGLAQPEDVAHG